MKVAAGFAYRWAFDETFLSGTVDLQFGVRIRRISVGGRGALQVGRTLAGLSFWDGQVGPWLDMEIHRRVRLGGGLHVGTLFVVRRTDVSTPADPLAPVMLGAFGGGLTIELDVDLVRDRQSRSALFLGLRPGLEVVMAEGLSPSTLTVTLLLGYRR